MAKYTYKQFIEAHKGKALDYDGVAGCQCVDLAKYYLNEVFGLQPGAWGDAHDYYDNFNNVPQLKENFTRIANTPDFVPQKGDIMVWSSSLSKGGWGHIAICSGEGDTTWFNSWDCNWTGNHDPATKIKHNYNHVLGVLRPKDQSRIKISTKEKSTNKNSSSPYKILDISEWQTTVDYAAVAKEIDGAIIRIGYRGWGTAGTLCKDNKFDSHIKGLVDNKIPYGFYFLSQAKNATEGEEEAKYAYNLIKSYKPSLPIYIDVEESTEGSGNGRADKISKSDRTKVAVAFCKYIEKKGLKAGVYTSESWFDTKITYADIKNYSIWVAKYGTNNGTAQTKPNISNYDGWQFTSVYKVKGISSGVDMSYFYKDFTAKNNTTTKKETNTKSPYTKGKVYKLLVDLKVRTGAGTSYTWKDRSQLTADGKKNSYNQTKAVLKTGTKVTALEVKKISDKEYWLQIPSGWVCARIDGDIYIE